MIIRISIIAFFICFPSLDATSKEYKFKQTNGPYGGYAYTIDLFNDTLFVGGVSGFWISSNWGETWEKGGLFSSKIVKIIADTEKWIVGSYRDKILISENRGMSWEQFKTGLPFWFNISDIIKKEEVLLLASDCCGIYKSTDQGETWAPSNNGINNYDFKNIYAGHSTIISIAIGTAGDDVFLSPDLGENWLQPDPDLSLKKISVYKDTLYGVMYRGRGIKISTDDGYSWYTIDNTSFPDGYVLALDINRFGYFISTLTNGLYKSVNGGLNWFVITPLHGSRTFQNIVTLNDQMFISSTQGVYRSNDGGKTWIDINDGRIATYVTSIRSFNNYLFAATYGGGMFRSIDNGKTWVTINTGLNHLDVNNIVVHQNKLFITTGGYYDYYGNPGIIYMSNNYGETWHKVPDNIPWHSTPYCITSNGNYLFLGNIDGLFRSSDGVHWQRLETGQWTSNTKAVATIGSTVVMGTGGSPSKYYLSNDNGNSWVQIETLNILHINNITSIGNTFYAGSNDISLVYKSADYGQSWERVNCPPLNYCAVSAFEKVEDTLYIGVNSRGYGYYESNGHGLLISPDEGLTWSHVIDSSLTMNITSLEWFNGELFAGTYGGGVIKYSSNTENIEPPEIPVHFKLYQNYPNPINAKTIFKYEIAEPGNVAFELYDVTGKFIYTLEKGFKKSGTYTIVWDATEFSSGVYLYKLTFGGQSKTKKCTVLK
jgi:photosystem II stability/assembly factor-like uncharacterized protein